MPARTHVVGVVALALGLLGTPVAGNRNFTPDWTFKGSALTEWQPVGQATWKAENGEIVGTPSSPEGGWLMLNKPYQDVQFATTFRCTGGCKAGVLVRAQKTPDGFKGVYVTLGDGPSTASAVKLTPDGREVSREPLSPGGGMVRFLAPAAPAGRGGDATPPAAGRTGGPGGPGGAPARGAGGGAARGALPDESPYTRPVYDYRPNDWNALEIIMDANILRVWLNDGPEAGVAGGRADDEAGRYGPIALYVGGTGEVRYKAVETKDLGKRFLPAEKVASRFRMQRVSDFYYAWSATAADINHDGVLDVVAGPYYYLGPDYQVSREIYLSNTNNPSNQYTPAMLNFAFDYTGDGWPDVLVTESRAFVMYVNPGTELRRWDRYPAFANSSEAVAFKDLDADGKPEAIIVNNGMIAYAKPNATDPTAPWIVHPVSLGGYGTNAQHGIGAGDINGDGRADIVHPYGWWEQPPNAAAATSWTFHPVALGRWPRAGSSPGGGEMFVYDVNGDKLNDVVTSLEGHGWGLAWYEQVRPSIGSGRPEPVEGRSAAGQIGFAEHMIMDDHSSTENAGKVTFSELHGMTVADIDGDGVLDIIVGKRVFAHNESYTDPDPYGDPVLYWYRTFRNPKAPEGVEFVPELIHNRSGVGSAVGTADLNKDGAVDILTSTNRGTFIFWGTPKASGRGR